MDIQTLKLFSEVAKTGSFLAASKNLNYAQSHISTRMQQLESDLNTTLFYRSNRGVTLTPKGTQLLSYSTEILSLTEQATMAMRDDKIAVGKLKLGSLETFSQTTLPKILAHYHECNPNVSISVTTNNSSQLTEGVLDRNFDLAFISGKIKHPSLVVKPYRNEEMVVVKSKNDVGDFNEYISKPNTLLVFHEGCYYRSMIEQYLRSNEIVPNKLIEFNSCGAIIANIVAGGGISYLPLKLVEQSIYRDLLDVHKLEAPYNEIPTYIIYRQDRYFDSAFSTLVNQISDSLPDDN